MDDRVEDDNGDESAPSPAEVTVLIDGSNVVYGTGFANTPKLERLTAVLEEFSRYPFLVRTIVDAHLRHTIDDREALERMMTEGHVLQAPAKTRADDYLMALAVRRQARGDTVYILTNDTFPLTGASRTVPRVTFMVIPFDGVDEWVFYPPLDALAGAIEQGFLSEPSALGEADIDTAPASEEKEETVEAPPSEPPRIAPDLMETFVGFIATYTPTLRPGDTIPFAHVA